MKFKIDDLPVLVERYRLFLSSTDDRKLAGALSSLRSLLKTANATILNAAYLAKSSGSAITRDLLQILEEAFENLLLEKELFWKEMFELAGKLEELQSPENQSSPPHSGKKEPLSVYELSPLSEYEMEFQLKDFILYENVNIVTTPVPFENPDTHSIEKKKKELHSRLLKKSEPLRLMFEKYLEHNRQLPVEIPDLQDIFPSHSLSILEFLKSNGKIAPLIPSLLACLDSFVIDEETTSQSITNDKNLQTEKISRLAEIAGLEPVSFLHMLLVFSVKPELFQLETTTVREHVVSSIREDLLRRYLSEWKTWSASISEDNARTSRSLKLLKIEKLLSDREADPPRTFLRLLSVLISRNLKDTDSYQDTVPEHQAVRGLPPLFSSFFSGEKCYSLLDSADSFLASFRTVFEKVNRCNFENYHILTYEILDKFHAAEKKYSSSRNSPDRETLISLISLFGSIISPENCPVISSPIAEALDELGSVNLASIARNILSRHIETGDVYRIYTEGLSTLAKSLGLPPECLADFLMYVRARKKGMKSYETELITSFARKTGFAFELLLELKMALEKQKQIVLTGASGTGKTFLAREFASLFRKLIPPEEYPDSGKVEFIQFHAGYSYGDFIEGLKPESRSDGSVILRLRDGIFKIFASRARNSCGRFLLVIDEIDRASIPEVFGELIYLLDNRGSELRLASSSTFSVPENLYLISTAGGKSETGRTNLLDDPVLARRFSFFELEPDDFILEKIFKLKKLSRISPFPLSLLNWELKKRGVKRENFIGHGPFMKIENQDDLSRIIRGYIKPLVERLLMKNSSVDSRSDAARVAQAIIERAFFIF